MEDIPVTLEGDKGFWALCDWVKKEPSGLKMIYSACLLYLIGQWVQRPVSLPYQSLDRVDKQKRALVGEARPRITRKNKLSFLVYELNSSILPAVHTVTINIGCTLLALQVWSHWHTESDYVSGLKLRRSVSRTHTHWQQAIWWGNQILSRERDRQSVRQAGGETAVQ